MLALDLAVALIPVLLVLGAMMLMDSYALVPPRRALASLALGVAAALPAYAIHFALLAGAHVDRTLLQWAIAPIVEETLKAAVVVGLVRRQRVGFLVDAGIHGFAAGSGFAIAENLLDLALFPPQSLYVWTLRGLGAALLHGSTTALVGIVAREATERHASTAWRHFVPAVLLAIACHALFNALQVVPELAAAAMLALMPLVLVRVFARSEHAMRDWLGRGLDSDADLFHAITSGELAGTPTGVYLDSLRGRFPGTVVADMLCLLQLHAELSIRAKGVLIARAAGVTLPPDPELRARFAEMRFLERAIGATGLLAILPLRRTSSRDLWQWTVLESG